MPSLAEGSQIGIVVVAKGRVVVKAGGVAERRQEQALKRRGAEETGRCVGLRSDDGERVVQWERRGRGGDGWS